MSKTYSPIRALRLAVRVACATWLLQSGHASAMGLMQAYQAALQNDAQYRSAIFDAEAGKEYQRSGRSGLLPKLEAS